MSDVLWAVDSIIQRFFDLVVIPLEELPGWLSLVIASAVTGVLFVWFYSFISPQARIRSVKRSIGRSLYEAVIFRRDPILSMRAQWDLLKASFSYLGLAALPVLILSIPGAIWMSQFYYRMGKAPLSGEVVVEGRVADAKALKLLELDGQGNVAIGPMVRRVGPGSFAARAMLDKPAADAGIKVTVGSQAVILPLVTAEGGVPREARAKLDAESFFVPSGSIIKAPDAISQVWVSYPDAVLPYLGGMTWLTAFILLSLVFGYLGGRALGVAL